MTDNQKKLERFTRIITNITYGLKKQIIVKDFEKDELTDFVISRGNANEIYEFAVFMEGVGINKLTEAIIKTGDEKYILLFARDAKFI